MARNENARPHEGAGRIGKAAGACGEFNPTTIGRYPWRRSRGLLLLSDLVR